MIGLVSESFCEIRKSFCEIFCANWLKIDFIRNISQNHWWKPALNTSKCKAKRMSERLLKSLKGYKGKITMKVEFIIIELTLLLFEEVLGSSYLARSWNRIIGQKWVNNREPSIKYVPKIFRKANISNPLIRTRTCTYQGVRNVSFSENFT